MKPMVVKPEKEQKTLWLIGWGITFFLFLVLDVILIFVLNHPESLIFGICLTALLIIMLLVLRWIPAFYKSLEYVIDIDSITGKKGVFWKKIVTVPYFKITNIDITQGPVQRMFNLGTIRCQTAGLAGPQGQRAELKLLGIRDIEGVKDTIRERIRDYNTLKSK
jgi:membrane protein YdbS with pleckstrin-like domain